MFEKGETGHNGERIVRIGINKKGNLKQRLSNHYLGKGKSVLRKHISKCIPNSTKQEITEYIQKNITFVLIEIKEQSYREELEKKLIGTIARCVDCKASSKWLGKKHPNKTISGGKLWNIQGVRCIEEITDNDLQNIFVRAQCVHLNH